MVDQVDFYTNTDVVVCNKEYYLQILMFGIAKGGTYDQNKIFIS